MNKQKKYSQNFWNNVQFALSLQANTKRWEKRVSQDSSKKPNVCCYFCYYSSDKCDMRQMRHLLFSK